MLRLLIRYLIYYSNLSMLCLFNPLNSVIFFFSSRRRHTRSLCDWSSDVCSSDLMGTKGVIASTAGLAILLQEGIGDTIRVSLTPRPGGDRTEEVHVAQQVLQSLGLRHFVPQVSACPGCGRTTSTFFQEMAEQIQAHLKQQMPAWRARYPGVETLRVAVMG